jgi:endonuclease-3 related protein
LIATKARYAEIQKLALDAFRMDAPSSLIKHFNEFHAVIVEVGKLHCRRPKCEGCPLAFDLDTIGGQPVLS